MGVKENKRRKRRDLDSDLVHAVQLYWTRQAITIQRQKNFTI